jgi:hypothetical protein
MDNVVTLGKYPCLLAPVTMSVVSVVDHRFGWSPRRFAIALCPVCGDGVARRQRTVIEKRAVSAVPGTADR